MPQQTNLHVSPYFDDFDPANDYHKVLFKPGYPVQARELTTLQSILQNQIERFGQHFFKEGAKVIPGNIGYNQLYYAIQLQNNYQGVPVSAYAEQLIGTKITGQRSGVTAFVDSVLLPEDSERGNLTLYINYLGSSTANNSTQQFFDGEALTCNETISSGLLGNTTITAGAPFANTFETAAAATGCSFQIEEGIYFIRGNFVNVSRENLILDQYTNTPSYRIGLFVNEEIVTSDLDETLNDNSQGYNNYAAPGADRLRISTSLFKKPLDDFNDDNFILLATVIQGVLQTSNLKRGNLGGGAGYKDWTDILARRTFDESGHYYVKPFDLTVVNSLNDNVGNAGIFNAGQFTPGGESARADLALYKISPGKAYVQGYEIESLGVTYLDVDKPRTTRTLENQNIVYNTGPTFRVNTVFRSPTIGIGNTYAVSLRNQRVGSDQNAAPGKEIGLARVYDFRLESGSYNSTNANLNQWDLALFDIQTTTEIALNQAHTLNVPTFVKGESSGATGFLRYNVNAGTAVTVYETIGNFVANERLTFNGIENGRIAIAVTANTISDVKSIYGTSNTLELDDGITGVNTFSANVIQSPKVRVGVATITPTSGGISTVRSSSNDRFPGTIVKENDIIQYTDTTSAGLTEDPITARVVSVGATHITIEGVNTVSGIASGFLPTSQIEVSDFRIVTSDLAPSSDSTLFTPLPRANVSDVDISESVLTIRKTFTVNIASNQLSFEVQAAANETFLSFDDERYLLTRSDGSTETLSSDKFEIGADGKTLQIRGLGTDNTDATLVATLRKTNPKAKVKIKNPVNSIIVNKSKLEGSGIGSTTLNNGLVYGAYPFGTRVEDETISLNFPDVIEIHGVYESADTSAASAPRTSLLNINSTSTTTSEFLLGERIIGQNSGAVAILVEIVDDSNISFIYKNQGVFVQGETVTFQDSNLTATISTLSTPSFNVSPNYTFRTGQRNTFYNYGSIRRRNKATAPSNQLRIYFSSASYASTDDGDVTTVNSYNQFNYSTEIKDVGIFRNSDIIDIRPRVSNYTVTTGVRSPLEFLGRTFNSSGQAASNVLASDEAITADVSYYQGRIDRVFLSKDGRFQIVYGAPSDDPVRPNPVEGAIEVCTINLPPYLYSVEDAKITFSQYKRYRMQDIKKLEDRIRNLEYYTTLSLLEKETANLFLPDNDGFNRFKSGFFIDNFSGFKTQDTTFGIQNSIDRKYGELRPKHYTTSVDLIYGPVVDTDATNDTSFGTVEGTNIRREPNDIIVLDYAEVEYLSQTFATRTESVTPFLISFWNGNIELTPASDNWVDQERLEAKIIETEGDYAETFNKLVDSGDIDAQTGLGSILWDSWETTWGATEEVESTKSRTESGGASRIDVQGPGGRSRTSTSTRTVTDKVYEDTIITQTQSGVKERTGTYTVIVEDFEKTSIGDKVVSSSVITNMRSRNVTFDARRVKPLTRLYAFFDGKDVTKFCVPKLLEITMTSGTFQVGETVEGVMQSTGLSEDLGDSSPKITFRVAQSNHKEGAYDAPTKTFPQNPYTVRDLPQTYSSTSDVLNIDVASLATEARGDFHGFVRTGMVLKGKTSGAEASINNLRLLSDLSATLIGSFYIPNPNNTDFPKFETGTKVFTLVNDADNNQDAATTIAEEVFTSAGTLEKVQENIISVRNAKVEEKKEFETENVSRELGTEVTGTRLVSSTERTQTVVTWYDPLAQSFLVKEETGVFMSSCDIFFRSKDDMDIPVTFQLRTLEGGFPSRRILPFSEINIDPDDIETSSDGSIATNIKFKAPVYLEGGKEYAICLASNSTKYSVYISRVGENDILTDTFLSNQPNIQQIGSLFKSQNASTWEPSQWEDLKFTLYRADFVESGSIEFYSPELTEGNKQIPKLKPNPINSNSREIRVGLGTTVADVYEIGNTFFQSGTNATGDLVGTAGTAVGTLTVTNAGIGYTPLDGNQAFSGVNLVTITGNGRGATADVTVNSGVIGVATIMNGGSGYQVGDVLGITTIGVASLGRNARLTVPGIGQTSELILNNVQGEFVVGSANTMFFFNSSGISTELNSSGAAGLGTGGDVQISTISIVSDGLHLNVNHKNHGMYFTDNSVILSGVAPDVKPTTLTAAYPSDSTGGITVALASNFGTFEKVGVGTTNTGYLLIGDEIIEYTSVNGNTIGGDIVRGANPKTYPTGTAVYKYEFNDVNLNRINTTHNLANVTESDPFTFDSYKVKLDMSSATGTDRSTDVGWPKLYVGKTKSSGGYHVRATQNIPFELITPKVENLTVPGTVITGELRTTTSTSFSGNETPFVDSGFSDITVNQKNYFDSPRMIASKVNEDAQLTTVPGSKSLNMRLFLNTTDTKISPVIDGQRVSAVLTSNRVNDVITNYATDPRVDSPFEDPTACQYVSKEILLENPASSIKIILSAHLNEDADLRAFYAVSNEEGTDPVFSPFPGYSNLNTRGEVINPENNNGLPDSFVVKSSSFSFEPYQTDYREYVFTVNDLPSFRNYRIKLNLTSRTQCYVPKIKELRVIALA
jgi:hypothetical protein